MTPDIAPVLSVEDLICRIREDSSGWHYVWFRGEPNVPIPLIPKLYRPKADGSLHRENPLLQLFRMKAPSFASSNIIPDRGATDQWLFLAQHVGLPTRLLDWTEGALVALHFALLHPEPVVWMLDPMGLNVLSTDAGDQPAVIDLPQFPLTWMSHGPLAINIGSINVRGAWESDGVGVPLPVAVLATNIHPRMSVQRSCFTVQGMRKDSLAELIPGDHLKRYPIDPGNRSQMRRDLRLLGVDHSTVFPDLDGLAKELGERF